MAYRESLTDKQWEKWARQNPYFGVLLVESSSMEDEGDRQHFFATGEHHIAHVLADIEHLYGLPTMGSAVDFGCGVGRLLRPLAKRFDHVCGIDVSPTMLELARENTEDFDNIDFVRTPQDLLDRGEQFDFVHSYIVLQHIRIRQGSALIDQLARLTKPGGVFALHVTVGDPRLGRRALNGIRYRMKPVHWLYNVTRGRKWDESITEMHGYDAGTVIRNLAPLTGGLMSVRYVDQNDRNSIIIYGRRIDSPGSAATGTAS